MISEIVKPVIICLTILVTVFVQARFLYLKINREEENSPSPKPFYEPLFYTK